MKKMFWMLFTIFQKDCKAENCINQCTEINHSTFQGLYLKNANLIYYYKIYQHIYNKEKKDTHDIMSIKVGKALDKIKKMQCKLIVK